jgi:hypothetical protein
MGWAQRNPSIDPRSVGFASLNPPYGLDPEYLCLIVILSTRSVDKRNGAARSIPHFASLMRATGLHLSPLAGEAKDADGRDKPGDDVPV